MTHRQGGLQHNPTEAHLLAWKMKKRGSNTSDLRSEIRSDCLTASLPGSIDGSWAVHSSSFDANDGDKQFAI